LFRIQKATTPTAALVTALLLAYPLQNAQGDDTSLPKQGICAHRGASSTHPENTIAAFQEAIRLGAHMIEFDAWLTKDGQIVVMHDDTVDRTTDGHGRIADLTLDEIKRLGAGAWKAPDFAGQRVPTLKETLAIMPTNIWLNVHCKQGAPLGEKVAREILETKREHQAFLACNHEAADAARRINPAILICNMERDIDTPAYVDDTIERKADFIQLRGKITPDLSQYTQRLKENGVRVNFFGTDKADELRVLFAAGVDFPLVNAVTDLMPVAKELGFQPVVPKFPEPQKAEK